VGLHAAGASRVRVRIAQAGTRTISLDLADGAGLPVLSVQELVVRPVSAGALDTNHISSDGVVVWQPGSGTNGPVGSVHSAVHEVLGVLQSWLAGDGSGVLVVLTRGAVGVAGEGVTDLAGAAVWGLVRSAQAENPGRVVLVDSDGSLDVTDVIGCGEPQLAVRSGVAHAARLAPVGAGAVLELPAAGWRLAAGGG